MTPLRERPRAAGCGPRVTAGPPDAFPEHERIRPDARRTCADFAGAPGGTRTHTMTSFLRRAPRPVGLRGPAPEATVHRLATTERAVAPGPATRTEFRRTFGTRSVAPTRPAGRDHRRDCARDETVVDTVQRSQVDLCGRAARARRPRGRGTAGRRGGRSRAGRPGPRTPSVSISTSPGPGSTAGHHQPGRPLDVAGQVGHRQAALPAALRARRRPHDRVREHQRAVAGAGPCGWPVTSNENTRSGHPDLRRGEPDTAGRGPLRRQQVGGQRQDVRVQRVDLGSAREDSTRDGAPHDCRTRPRAGAAAGSHHVAVEHPSGRRPTPRSLPTRRASPGSASSRRAPGRSTSATST